MIGLFNANIFFYPIRYLILECVDWLKNLLQWEVVKISTDQINNNGEVNGIKRSWWHFVDAKRWPQTL